MSCGYVKRRWLSLAVLCDAIDAGFSVRIASAGDIGSELAASLGVLMQELVHVRRLVSGRRVGGGHFV